MSTSTKTLLAFLAGVLVVAGISFAGYRPVGEFNLLLRLNGQPKVKGHIRVTDAGVVTNATTQFPFTLAGGETIEVVCNSAACVRPGVAPDGGAVVNCNYQDDNMGRPMSTGVSRWFTLLDSTTTVSVVPNASSSTDCSVAVME